MSVMYTNTIPGMHRNKPLRKKVRTNTEKQTIGYAACISWDKVPLNLYKHIPILKTTETLFTVRTA